MKQNIEKRSIRLNFTDGSYRDLELSRAVSVKTSNEMLNLDRLADGTWRLIWNESLIPDFSQIVNFEVIRECTAQHKDGLT